MNAHATTAEMPAPTRRQPVPLNGVDTPKLFATIAAVDGQRSLAQFQPARRASGWTAPTCGAR